MKLLILTVTTIALTACGPNQYTPSDYEGSDDTPAASQAGKGPVKGSTPSSGRFTTF